ncbi:MAG: TylF/MycF/NovP-related O-methyltransferase [Candidatus Saccharimonadales bacterium]
MADIVTGLLSRYPLISDQVDKQQVELILRELEKVCIYGAEGAVVEFGCYTGTTSLFIRRLLDTHSPARAFHVYDSFEGLPAKSTWDASATGEAFTAGELAVSKKLFLREFHRAHLHPPVVHKGWFKDLTAGDVPDKIAFAFLDGDFYESIRDSLRLVLPRLQPGGTIIVDDYSREALPGVARAVHEHFRPETITTRHNLAVIHS